MKDKGYNFLSHGNVLNLSVDESRILAMFLIILAVLVMGFEYLLNIETSRNSECKPPPDRKQGLGKFRIVNFLIYFRIIFLTF